MRDIDSPLLIDYGTPGICPIQVSHPKEAGFIGTALPGTERTAAVAAIASPYLGLATAAGKQEQEQ
jgi:hypothetical protein